MAGNDTSMPGISPDAAASLAEAQKTNISSILAGCVIQSILFGNLFSLTWRYYTHGRRGDPLWFNVAIGVAWILTALSVGISGYGLWFFAVGIMKANVTTPWPVDFFFVFNAAVAAFVRLLYVYRLRLLCQNLTYFRGRAISRLLLIFTVLLCLADLAGSIAISVRLYLSTDAERGKEEHRLATIFYIVFATGVSADAILTGMMCWWLHSARTGLHRTDSIINTMIRYSIQTGLFPSIVETGGMIAFFAAPGTQVFIAFYIQVGVLYLSSLLTSLNTRQLVHRRIQQPISVNFSALGGGIDGQNTEGGSSGIARLSLEGSPNGQHLRMPEDITEEKAMTRVADIERPQETPRAREWLARDDPIHSDVHGAWVPNATLPTMGSVPTGTPMTRERS